MVESPDELASFFSADEFGAFAVCEGFRAQGIPDAYHDDQRPGATTNSSMGAFMVGAADMNLSTHQFTTTWPLPTAWGLEKTLTIEAGEYAGTYRIKDIQRDGSVVRLMLNKRPA